MLIFLWTDLLVYLLLLLTLIAIYFAMRNKHTRARWFKVYRRPSRIIASMILMVFVVVGLLDSIHYVPKADTSNNIMSLLDKLLYPISTLAEKSYSAPFATHLFIPDMHKDDSGAISWIAAPLQYVSPVSIWNCIGQGLIDTIIIFSFCIALAWLVLRKYKNVRNINRTSMFTILITYAAILLVTCTCAHLMQHYHIFGTDKIGEDVFYSSLKSVRTGLIIGILATVLTLPFAVLFGAMAGYFRGWIDDLIQYLYTTLSSIPGVLLIAAAMLSLDAVIARHSNAFTYMAQRADARLLLLCAILGVTSWTTLCRILRGETLKLRDQEFILSARVIGLNNMQIIIKHIVPNLLHIILISLILDFSGLVLAEAVLSYVGVGVDASMFSWGNMINAARTEMGRDPVIWWSLTGAFVMMFMLVLAANIFADGVRDAFDPRTA